jgi:dipeptidyl aminopeptidase/acylaminoacyl peptidase
MTQSEFPALIPREILFGNPERTNPQLAPDGQSLAYIAPDERNVPQVWLHAIEREDDRALTADRRRGIRRCFWAYDGEQFLYLQDADGDENWHLHAVDVGSEIVRDLTPFEGIRAHWMVMREPRVPREVLVGLNLRDRRRHDLYRVDLRNGAVAFDTENLGAAQQWAADAAFRVRAALANAPDGGGDLRVRGAAGQPWRTVRHWGPDDWCHIVGFSADGTTLYIIGNYEANSRRLLALALATGEETVLAEDPQHDVDDDPWYHRAGVLFHPVERTAQAVGFYRDRLEWQVLDSGVAADFAAIARAREGEFRVVSRDLADRRWLVAYTTDDGPTHYHLYDRNAKTSRLLFSDRPQLEGLPLTRKRPIAFDARDGLTIHGYLTLPPGMAPRGLPAVLLVHGGPNTRDTWGFEPEVQWLANRGYAVLQVNFRGSTGYGRGFRNAGNREWGGKMQDDLRDGVVWLVERGTADPGRVAIMGFSYGGYAALAGLTLTPDVFAAGVALCGPSNLITFLRGDAPLSEAERVSVRHCIGDPETEEAFLRSRSPLSFADRVTAPLLIAQGANDPRIKQAEGDQMAAAMRRAGKSVEYVVYADEGHGLARAENRLHFYARAEAFLARHLGGRCEPPGEVASHAGVDQ